jgi:hypothetical protein
MLDRLVHQLADDVERALLERLLQIPEGAGVEGFDGVLRAAVAGDDDARQLRI